MSRRHGPLGFFGLDEAATTADVKRAYARLLRATRPDEDPEGFQRLRAMYANALACVEYDAVEAAIAVPSLEATSERFEEKDEEDKDDASVVRFDFQAEIDALYDQIVERGQQDDGAAMTAWLLSHEALWSLQHKEGIAAGLAYRLRDEVPMMAPAAFDALHAFFNEWHVDRGDDPYDMESLRPQLLIRWYLQPEHHVDCARLLVDGGFVRRRGSALAYVRRIAGSFARWKALLLSLIPGVPTRMCDVMHALRPLPEEMLDGRQIAWWRAAGDRTRWSWPRTTVGLLRAFLYALPIVPLLWMNGERGAVIAPIYVGAVMVLAMSWLGGVLSTVQREDGRRGGVGVSIFGILMMLSLASHVLRACSAG